MPRRLSPLLLALVAGCATNALRVQGASDFVTASKTTVARANSYLNEVAMRQRSAAAALVASDPSCFPGTTIRIRSPNSGRQPLCMLPGEPQNARNSFDFTLQPLGPAQLKPRLQLLAAIADYAAALGKVVDADKPDVSAELTEFVGRLDDLTKVAGFVSGQDIPSATPALKSDQARSIIALLQFAAELRQEQDQVDTLRWLAETRGDDIDHALASLDRQMSEIEEIDHDDATIEQTMLVQNYTRSAARLDYERRVAAVRAILEARASVADRAAAAEAVRSAVAELTAAHATLRELLRPNPTLTDKQRKERRRIAHARLWRALDLVAGAATAFGGV